MASVEVFWESEPEHLSERDFLAQLRAHFTTQEFNALILANFHIGAVQIDFLVVTLNRLSHIELKHYIQPLVGAENGLWKARQADGSLQDIPSQKPVRPSGASALCT